LGFVYPKLDSGAARIARAVAIASALCGCSAPVLVKPPTVEDADDQVATCKVARDPLRPLIVEWPGTSKVELESGSRRGLVIVSYMGCNLKVLANCHADGTYGFTGTTPARDSVAVDTMTELYARLPLGAASLKGELSQGSALDLEYIAVGVKRAEGEPMSLSGDCDGATHFVEQMTLGAYSLDAVASGAAGGGLDVQGAGLGGGRKEERRKLRGSGAIDRCEGKAPEREDDAREAGCGAILQIGLAPLRGAGAPSPVAAVATDGDAAARRSDTPAYSPPRPSFGGGGADRDGDGIGDAFDKCPDEPEDKDGFQDQDGCPESDNDSVPDATDACPNDPEDKDGFQDDDGCPDPDNDADGVPDALDKCPNTRETMNGFEDEDGCPDAG
jgi:hypothetical protein